MPTGKPEPAARARCRASRVADRHIASATRVRASYETAPANIREIIIETSTAERLRLVTAALPVRGARADRFLRLAAGSPRGFWARGDRWVAHRGVLTSVDVGTGSDDRFREIRQLGEALATRSAAGPEDPRLAGRIRFYGGFSFAGDHRPEGPWEAFPAALFHLPRLELEGDAEGIGRLRMRAPVVDGREPEEVRSELLERLVGIRDELLDDDGSSRPGSAVRSEEGDRARRSFEAAVDEALEEIEDGRLSKAVLARALDVTPRPAADPAEVACRLWRQNRGAHAFLFEPRPGHALVGAAPECVAMLRRGVFHATAVAGSTTTGDSPAERSRRAAALLASEKDRQEQAMVVDDMVARLRPLADGLRVQEEPHVLTLARIQHLETEIRARVGPGRHVLELVEALHPTPAVCGVPRDEALAFLREEEPFRRGWYAGPVGWFDTDGDGVFVPALRTAVSRDGRWRLFAGAGIVAGSVPASEWEETRIKFEPVLRALREGGECRE